MKQSNQRSTDGARSTSATRVRENASADLPREALSRREVLTVLVIVVMGATMRFAYPARLAIEHWDEAVYSSNLFVEGGYPFRHLYAPPLLPAVIECSMILLGASGFAAILPNLLFGTLTVLLCWWVGREWFGIAAGLASAAAAALSDFHIVYSRTALTDAPLCFWFLLAVYFGWRALDRRSVGEAIMAGLAVAAAWWTKYNGWLPLAVIISGALAWALTERLDRRRWVACMAILAVIAIAATAGWYPVWSSLQQKGGYAVVSANHAKYFVGLMGWSTGFTKQAAFQWYYSGVASCLGLALGWLLPLALPLRSSEFRSTTPHSGQVGGHVSALILGTLLSGGSLLAAGFFGASTLVAAASVAFMIVGALGIRTAFHDRSDGQRAAGLAGWLVSAWVLGMTVAVPLYWPYPRLALPWLVSTWIAWGAVVAWVIRVLGFRKAGTVAIPPGRSARSSTLSRLRCATVGLLLPVSLAAVWLAVGKKGIPGWQDRTGRRAAILTLSRTATQGVAKEGKNLQPVFLVYGEPVIFFTLAAAGFDAVPLGDLAGIGSRRFGGESPVGLPQSEFLMVYETQEFQKMVKPYRDGLRLIALDQDVASDLVLLDSIPPAELQRQERPAEELGLYQLTGQ